MDDRCPRKLKSYPDQYCELAVLRLKAIRNAGCQLTEDEENELCGCQFAISSQMSCYCAFKFFKDLLGDHPLSDAEIAHLNSITIEEVKRIERKALEKLKKSRLIKELLENYTPEEE